MLKTLIEQELKKNRRGGGFLTKIRVSFHELYIPSFRSVLLVLFLIVLFFAFIGSVAYLIRQIPQSYVLVSPMGLSSNHYQNLIAIHAGIGTVIFALVIFVAESMRDNDTDRARVLLKVSYLFPLTVAEIIVFFSFLWFDSNIPGILPVVFIGLAAIFSLSKIVTLQLNKFFYQQKRIETLKERVKQSIDLAMRERIGKNLLFKRLGSKDVKLQYTFPPDEEEKYVIIKSNKFGIVQNIDLARLEKFARILDSEAQSNGFSFEETEAQDIEASRSPQPQASRPKKLLPNPRRQIYKTYHDSVTEEHASILGFDKTLVRNPRKIEELVSLGQAVFVVGPGDSFAEEIHQDISSIKDQFSAAIKNSALGKIGELAILYISIAEGFLEQLDSYDATYTFEQAVQERKTIFAGWEQVKWLSTDLLDLSRQALDTRNIEVIRKVTYIPIAISRRAIEKDDHYLFQEFIWFPELLYASSQKVPDNDLRKYLIDRSWRYVNELASFYIESKLAKASLTTIELESLKNFAVYILVRMQALLKQSFDARDLESFNTFKSVTNKLFRRFTNDREVQNSEFLKLRLENVNLGQDERQRLDQELKTRLIRERIQKEIKNRRDQMLFGLGSWVLFIFSQNRDDRVVAAFFDSIRMESGTSLEHLTQVFLDSHSFETEDFWNWDRWESIPDGEVHSIDVLGKLEKFFAVQALSLLANRDDDAVNAINLPPDRDLVGLVEGARSLMKILNEIRANPENWAYVLSSLAAEKVDTFVRLLSAAKRAQELIEEAEVRRRSISPERVRVFKETLVREFHKSADLRGILNYWGLIQSSPNENAEFQFGISTADDKASFFDEWFVHYLDWGENYGRGMAEGEDVRILQALSEHCQVIREGTFEQVLSDSATKKEVAIFFVNGSFISSPFANENFVSEWAPNTKKLEVKGFAGWYKAGNKTVPVFEIYSRQAPQQILILEQKQIGRLTQYQPKGPDNPAETIVDIFSISVRAFSEDAELLRSFLDEAPLWLQEKGSRQDQETYLTGRVLVEVFESFKFEIGKDAFGFKLNIPSPPHQQPPPPLAPSGS